MNLILILRHSDFHSYNELAECLITVCGKVKVQFILKILRSNIDKTEPAYFYEKININIAS